MKYICLLFALLLVGCGSGTVGPLITNGLDARRDLQSSVRTWQRHDDADSKPLDALLVIDHQDVLPSGVPTTGWIVSEEGLIPNPLISVYDRPLISRGNGSGMRMIRVLDPLLSVNISWPDTTITFTDTVFTEQELMVDTVRRSIAWSKSTSPPIQTFDPRADSLVLDIAIFTDSLNSVGDTSLVVPDTGSFTLPPSIISAIKPGDQILVLVGRSHYRMHSLRTPTSGYGDRVVGILQKRTSSVYHVVVTP